MAGSVSFERHGDVGVVMLTAPNGASMTEPLRSNLVRCLEKAMADGRVRTIVLLCEGDALAPSPGCSAEDASLGIAAMLENSPKPVIAALDGTALDEGLELLLACRARLATRRSAFGFPCAGLGRVPASGGTQRLPRLIGPVAALDLLASGAVIEAGTAENLGLIDAVEKDPLIGSAVSAARRLADTLPPRVRDRTAEGNAGTIRRAIDRLSEAGFPDGLLERLGEAMIAAATLPFEAGMQVEAALAAAARADTAVAARHHLARSRTACANAPDLTAEEGWPLGTVAVVGAGVMGSDIAILCAEHGLPVMLLDRDPLAVSRGLGRANDHFTRRVNAGTMTEAEADRRVALIQHSTKIREIAQASLVIEAVTEDAEIKETVFHDLGERCRPCSVLASNTAALDVDRFAAASGHASQVLGLHVHGPVFERRVIEIAAGRETDPSALRTAATFATRVGRVPVSVANHPGFVGPRLLEAYLREAWLLAEEGANPARIDEALEREGFTHGPYSLNDRLGLNGGWRLRDHLEGSDDDRLPRASRLPEHMAAHGRGGLSTGAGWYLWSGTDPDARPSPDDGWLPAAAETARARGIIRRDVPMEEACERLVLAVVNQSLVLLDKGHAHHPGDVDVVAVDALGFPESWGGPVFWASREGLTTVVDRLKALEAVHGARFHPAPLLVRLADKGLTPEQAAELS
jgi:3-hydroxyacyl-CoA dehydrogenase